MKILCYGDSNTWGYIPNINGYSKDAVMQQYNEQDCWWYPLMQGHEVIVDGLCGRCISHENKWLKNRNASETILNDFLKTHPKSHFMQSFEWAKVKSNWQNEFVVCYDNKNKIMICENLIQIYKCCDIIFL